MIPQTKYLPVAKIAKAYWTIKVDIVITTVLVIPQVFLHWQAFSSRKIQIQYGVNTTYYPVQEILLHQTDVIK